MTLMYLQPPINIHADVFRGARCIKIGLTLHFHPYFFCILSRGGSGESAHLRRLT